jgi:anti-sigma regulatory factor (Ser/Thr protein kinase)
MSFEVRQRFLHGPLAPGAAREALDAALSDRLKPDVLGELRLMVSELVTNAVRHGRARKGAVDLLVAMQGRTVRVEVSDGGAGFTPPGREPALGEAGGWGLIVVDRLADRWGIEADPDTRVWAEMRLAPPGTNGGGTVARQVVPTV